MTKKVLIGSAGTGNAFSTCMSLRRLPDFDITIITSDINPAHLVTASLLADLHFVVKPYMEHGFEKQIQDIIIENNIDTYLPFIDAEISMAAKQFENGLLPGIKSLQVKKYSVAEICENKLLSFEFLQKCGIRTPLTIPISANESDELFILKPVSGFGSKTRKVRSNEVQDLADKNRFVLQEICEGPEVTIDVSRSKEFNFFRAVCRERIQTKEGVCTKARLFQDDELSEIAKTIADDLELHSFCFQVMKLNGNWAVIDINPRLGAGSAMSYCAGYDFFGAMISIMWDQDPSKYIPEFSRECYVTRQYSEFLMGN